MLKKHVEFKDFDGKDHSEDHYFNLTRAEITEIELSTKGGLVEHLNSIVAAKNGKAIVEAFKMILRRSYGIKTPDGRFEKSDEIFKEFESSMAYDEIFMEICTNPDAAAVFVNGIVPPQKSN